MTDKIARVCNYCGKADVLKRYSDSNGMIIIFGDNVFLMLMRDIREGESGRLTLTLTGKAYCPECLPKAITEWIERVK